MYRYPSRLYFSTASRNAMNKNPLRGHLTDDLTRLSNFAISGIVPLRKTTPSPRIGSLFQVECYHLPDFHVRDKNIDVADHHRANPK
jgi:hypothetical protein